MVTLVDILFFDEYTQLDLSIAAGYKGIIKAEQITRHQSK